MFLLGQSEGVDKSQCSSAQISELRICIESFYGKLLNSYLFYFFFPPVVPEVLLSAKDTGCLGSQRQNTVSKGFGAQSAVF